MPNWIKTLLSILVLMISLWLIAEFSLDEPQIIDMKPKDSQNEDELAKPELFSILNENVSVPAVTTDQGTSYTLRVNLSSNEVIPIWFELKATGKPYYDERYQMWRIQDLKITGEGNNSNIHFSQPKWETKDEQVFRNTLEISIDKIKPIHLSLTYREVKEFEKNQLIHLNLLHPKTQKPLDHEEAIKLQDDEVVMATVGISGFSSSFRILFKVVNSEEGIFQLR